jgi:hypothetical protein
MVIIPGRYERVLISRSTSMKVEVSKRPNGGLVPTPSVFRA